MLLLLWEQLQVVRDTLALLRPLHNGELQTGDFTQQNTLLAVVLAEVAIPKTTQTVVLAHWRITWSQPPQPEGWSYRCLQKALLKTIESNLP
jgi:hypothetical protein